MNAGTLLTLTHLRHPTVSHIAVAKLVSALSIPILADTMPAPLSSVGNEYGTASDQNHAEPIWQCKPFAQEEHCKN